MKIDLNDAQRDYLRELVLEDIEVIVAADPSADKIIEKLPRLCLVRDVLKKLEGKGAGR